MHERRIAGRGLAPRRFLAVPSLLVVASRLAVALTGALMGAWASPPTYGQQYAPVPLYRFAWESCSPSPYEIYCFYQPPLPDVDLDFHQRLVQEIAGSNAGP